jgi:hypothetical protein
LKRALFLLRVGAECCACKKNIKKKQRKQHKREDVSARHAALQAAASMCKAIFFPPYAVLARLVHFFTRFFLWPAFGCSQHLVFFWAWRLGAQLSRFFLSPANGRIKRKQALFFITFSGFSLHGEFKHNSTYFPPKMQTKNPKKSQKI